MSQLFKAAHLYLLISALTLSSAAQGSQHKPPINEPPQEANARAARDIQDETWLLEKQRALRLLEQLFEQANGCNDETFKLRVQAELADLLWRYDENRARLELAAAFRASEAFKPEARGYDSLLPPEFSAPYQLRSEVLRLIARHDPAWARELGESAGIVLQDTLDTNAPSRADNHRPETIAQPRALSNAAANPVGAAQAAQGGSTLPLKFLHLAKPGGSASVPELLSQAEAARQLNEKDSFYTRAVLQALSERDFEQALASAEKIGQMQLRASFEALARTRAAQAALSREDFDAALRYSEHLLNLPQRAALLDQMIERLENKQDNARVAEILMEAERWLSQAEDGLDKSRALLTLAGAAARSDSMRGFELLQSAVVAINRVASRQQAGLAGKQTDFEFNALNLEQSFSLLAHADFDRAVQLAQTIEQTEVAVQAQLALCRGLLNAARRSSDSIR